jgi:hypothetical protein
MRRVWVPNAHTQHLRVDVSVDATLESLQDAVGWLESQKLEVLDAAPRPKRI